MSRLSREQVKKIIADAPPGTSPEGIIAVLRQDHELEGYPSSNVTTASMGGSESDKLGPATALTAAYLVGNAIKNSAVNKAVGRTSTALQGAPSTTGLGSRLRQAATGTLAESQSMPLTFARKFMESAPPNLPPPMAVASAAPPIASMVAPVAEVLPGPAQVGDVFAKAIAAKGRLLSPFEIADLLNAQVPPPIAAASKAKGKGKVPSRKIQVEGKPAARAPAQTTEPPYTGGRGASGPELARRAAARAQAVEGGSPNLKLVPQEMPQLPPAASLEDLLRQNINLAQLTGPSEQGAALRRAVGEAAGHNPLVGQVVFPGNASSPEQELQNAVEQFLMIKHYDPQHYAALLHSIMGPHQ